MKILFLLLFLVTISNFLIADTIHPAKLDSSFIERDSINSVDHTSKDELISTYQEILEKTNNQLSLWWNPYGVLIGVLGLLFAILAIGVTLALFRQGKEHKEMIAKFLEQKDIIFKNFINERTASLDLQKSNIDALLVELKSKGDNLNTGLINALTNQRNLIMKNINTYYHSGWDPLDVKEDIYIYSTTEFKAEIVLSKIGQEFSIYFQVVTTTNHKFWIGFGGNISVNPVKYQNEFTTNSIYKGLIISIQENVIQAYNERFNNLDMIPLKIDKIRMRASDSNHDPIKFVYEIT